MQPEVPPVSPLQVLQDQLKKQCLLLEREQREKAKIKKDIETSIQSYYSVIVEKKGLGVVVKEDKLGNSYNFIKEIVMALSEDITLGVQTLSCAHPNHVDDLTDMLLVLFYDSYIETDPYLKKVTTFGLLLAKRICAQIKEDYEKLEDKSQFELNLKVLRRNEELILRQYFKQEHIREYFEMLANKVFSKIPSSLRSANILTRWGSFIQPDHFDEEGSFVEPNPKSSVSLDRSKSFIVNHEQQIEERIQKLVEEYMSDMTSKAELLPVSIRVLIHTFKKELKMFPNKVEEFIWQMMFPQYLRPLSENENKRWTHFKNTFFKETVSRITQLVSVKVTSSFIKKVLDLAPALNEKKLEQAGGRTKRDKITINGGCVSYRQIYLVLQTLKKNNDHIKKLNERAANRALKVNEITPNYELFSSFKEPSTSFMVFTQLDYGEIVQIDYQSMHANCYKDARIMNMLKQILSDPGFHISHSLHNQTFTQYLQTIIREQELNQSATLNYSAPFIMKIKYFLHLLTKDRIDERQLFENMTEECLSRQLNNIELFRNNKTLLLQTLTSVNKACKVASKKKDLERNTDLHLKAVRILDSIDLSLCLSAPSTRPRKNLYTSAEMHQIMLEDSTQCFHQENIEEGLKYHATNVKDALMIFSEFKEVRGALNSGQDKASIYEALSHLMDLLKQQCRKSFAINTEEYNYFQKSLYKIILRELHEIFIENGDKSVKDIEFEKKLAGLSFIRANKIKIEGIDNFSDLDQVLEIVCRYLRNLEERKNPLDKIDAIKEALDIMRIALERGSNLPHPEKKVQEVLFAYCLIKARPYRFIASLNFIEVLLSKDKLVSKEGGLIKMMRNSVELINTEGLRHYILIEEEEYDEQQWKETELEKTRKFKESQLKNSAYI